VSRSGDVSARPDPADAAAVPAADAAKNGVQAAGDAAPVQAGDAAAAGRRRSGPLRWLPAAIWMGGIFWMSSRTGSEIDGLFPFAERLPDWMGGLDFGHVVAYYILGLLVLFGFGKPSPSAKWLTVAVCTLYGATDEFHQLFVDGRSAEWHDLANDSAGACLAVLTVSLPPVRRRFWACAGKRPMG